jgi:hypothetical protein
MYGQPVYGMQPMQPAYGAGFVQPPAPVKTGPTIINIGGNDSDNGLNVQTVENTQDKSQERKSAVLPSCGASVCYPQVFFGAFRAVWMAVKTLKLFVPRVKPSKTQFQRIAVDILFKIYFSVIFQRDKLDFVV